MYKFNLNGNMVTVDKDKKLLEYLREDTDLTSVKNGCGEGACGACMVIVDGKAVRACILTIAKIEGKNVTTVEGISNREKEVYSWAFSEAGAVQCGFCIPGMVISAKALIDVNNNPSRGDIKNALRGNICRCTGYIKIENAVEMAAKALRENMTVPKCELKGLIGENVHRVDAAEKILGTAEYVDDVKLEGMLYGSALRTPYPRALVNSIDTSEAQKLQGVVAIVTAKDIPGNRYLGHLVKDWPALIDIGEETRYVGDAVALVAAESKETLKKALETIIVEYEERKPITSPEKALAEGAPKIHPKGNILSHQVLKRGNVEEAIKNSKYVVTNKYSVPFTEHAFMEPECAIAMPEGDGVLLYTAGQNVFDEQHEIMELLGLPEDKVRVISKYVGGGFGGKEDMSVQHHAALLAYITKRKVKVLLSRNESIKVHPKRHAMEMEFTTACDESGILTAMKAVIISDTGAYASLGGPVLQRACTHAAGPYNYQNVDIEGTAVYTNNPPGGAFRGFGVTQSAFATESNLNALAELVGISAWEIRFRNAIEPGQVLPNGQIADNGTALKETLLAVKEDFESSPYAGIACALKNSGIGVGIPDIGRSRLTIMDGKVHVRCGAACIGQGLGTVTAQMVCETTGITYDKVVVEAPDTKITPNCGTTTASRQTVFAGESTRLAALKLKEDLENYELEQLEGKNYFGEYTALTDPMGSDKPNPVSHIAYGYATQVVILDEKGMLQKVVAAHDVGRAVNPKNVEGQIEGGVVMGLGYALTENYLLEDSIPKVKFGTLGLFRANQVPEIKSIIIEKNKDGLAYGAKGVGEIVVVPTAPAVQGAYYKLDGKFRTKLPLEDTAYRKKVVK
jgi:aldehyde oxidoreductase